jgi:hypothetical protein
MPEATALALVAAAAAVRWRRRILATLADPIWEAALAGGLAAGVVGTLVEDSGPVLLVVAMFALACLVAYAQGAPRLAPGVVSGAGRRVVAGGPAGDGPAAAEPAADDAAAEPAADDAAAEPAADDAAAEPAADGTAAEPAADDAAAEKPAADDAAADGPAADGPAADGSAADGPAAGRAPRHIPSRPPAP